MQLGGQLTRQVVRTSLREMRARLRDASAFHLSINVWATDVTDPSFHAFLEAQCAAQGIDPHRIALKLNERSTTDSAALAQSLQELREKGFRCSIDDFGTEHSNLAYLTTLPIDVLKLDQQFIRFIDASPLGPPIVAPIFDMIRHLDVEVVVEGIETEAQAEFVRAHAPGAIGQGWLLGRPVAIADFPAK